MNLWPISLMIEEQLEQRLVGRVGVSLCRLQNNVFKVCVWRNIPDDPGYVIYEMYVKREPRAQRCFDAQVRLHALYLSKTFFS